MVKPLTATGRHELLAIIHRLRARIEALEQGVVKGYETAGFCVICTFDGAIGNHEESCPMRSAGKDDDE